MEIIPWAPMEELESVLKPRGWQKPPPHAPNQPNTLYRPFQIHVVNKSGRLCLS